MRLINWLLTPVIFLIYIFRPETERERGEAEAWRARKRQEYINEMEAKAEKK